MNKPITRLLLTLLLGAALCTGAAAQLAPAAEVFAKDMREEIVRIPVTVRDMYQREETRPMAITIFRPPGEGRHPLVIFNHGRAVTDKRAAQGRSRPEAAARYLVAKGFVVLAPTRIGYWETYGDFDPEYSGSCNDMRLEPMSTAASDQVLAALAYASTLPYVDASRWLVAGQSVGGLTAVATVGRHPPGLVGGINFAGGVGGNPEKSPGSPCGAPQIARYWSQLAKSATAPMLWLYWKNDKYWGEDIPRQWYKAWTEGGAKAEFHSSPPSGDDGHNGLNNDMDTWLPLVDAFLGELGFRQAALVTRPPASGFAAINDTSKVPLSANGRQNGYIKSFLEADKPRAFAIGDHGAYGFATRDYVAGRALGFCQRSGQQCKLYAVDDDVVWVP
jgi:dienelactone hydrolase